jgi:beta-exotoxin I transport system permease protein
VIRDLLARNLRHQRNLLAALVLGLAAFEMLLVVAVAQLEAGPGLRAMVDMLPAAIREALASQLSLLSFASAVAFGFQHPFAIAASVSFVVLAATVPAAERESGLLDLILARPVSRSRYLIAVTIPVVIGALLLPLAQLAGAVMGLSIVRTPGALPWTRYLPSAAGLATVLLAVGGYTLLLATGARRRGPAVARAVGFTLAMYVLEALANIWKALEWIRWASPFHYFNPVQSAVLGSIPARNPVTLVVVFLVATALAFASFGRRDV